MDEREALLRVLAGPRNLKANRLAECDVDRVGALAIAQMPSHHARMVESLKRANHDAYMVALGRHVLALRIGNDARTYEPLLNLLAAEAERRLMYIADEDQRAWTARAVARRAIEEIVIDMCPNCSGKRNVPDHDKGEIRGKQPMKVCPSCGGSGNRVYSWFERARDLWCRPNDKIVREKIDSMVSVMREAAKKAEQHFADVLNSDE